MTENKSLRKCNLRCRWNIYDMIKIWKNICNQKHGNIFFDLRSKYLTFSSAWLCHIEDNYAYHLEPPKLRVSVTYVLFARVLISIFHVGFRHGLRICVSRCKDGHSRSHTLGQIRTIYHPDPIRITSFQPGGDSYQYLRQVFSFLREREREKDRVVDHCWSCVIFLSVTRDARKTRKRLIVDFRETKTSARKDRVSTYLHGERGFSSLFVTLRVCVCARAKSPRGTWIRGRENGRIFFWLLLFVSSRDHPYPPDIRLNLRFAEGFKYGKESKQRLSKF